MPFFIFYKAQFVVMGDLVITPLSPLDNELGIPKNSDLYFGLHITTGNPLDIDFNSLDLTWKGVSAISLGIAQDSYSYTKYIGYFNDHLGWVIRVVNTETSYTPSSPSRVSNAMQVIQAIAYAQNTPFTLFDTKVWDYQTGNKNAFNSFGHFGTYPGGRFYLLTSNIDNSQVSALGLTLRSDQFTSKSSAISAFIRSGALILEPNNSVAGHFEFEIGDLQGLLTTRQEYTEDQLASRPSLMTTFMGPLFGAIPLVNQIQSLKLQGVEGILTEAGENLITEDGEYLI